MGVQSLQNFLEDPQTTGASVPVDLIRIARDIKRKSQSEKNGKTGTTFSLDTDKLSLVVDGECCLDRLYGGYFSNWVCGGQWNRMIQYLANLAQQVQTNNIELAIFFNGCLEQQRMGEWIASQLEDRKRITSVLNLIHSKGTPPPKVWWTPPACLRTCLRMALRHLHVSVLCSMDDHHQEVIAYCRENSFHGLMADDGEYVAFDPPRYFSSAHLKLTFKGSLETNEYMLSEISKSLGLNSNGLCVMAALLGNYLLTENDMAKFYQNLGIKQSPGNIPFDVLVKKVAEFVKNLPSVDDLDSVAVQVFGTGLDKRVEKLKQSVQYYLNGTKDGFLRYQSQPVEKRQEVKRPITKQTDGALKLVSENAVNENESLASKSEPTTDSKATVSDKDVEAVDTKTAALTVADAGIKTKVPDSDSLKNNSNKAMKKPQLPSVAPEVMVIASDRHQKGLMSLYIYQILSQCEIKLPVLIEDENHIELPNIHLLFRPIRQAVYAILFNCHSAEKGENKELKVKEWIWSRGNPYKKPDLVKADTLGLKVPTIEKLWLGTDPTDKARRIHVFLQCMRADTPLMLNLAHVPQHLLILAAVLKYILSIPETKILRRSELDAFIAQAFAPELMNAQYLQDLELPKVTSRAVHLSTLFMEGVEMALMANDACGAPVPLLMCCPWLFFDGKLFHYKLSKLETTKNLAELCDHNLEVIVQAERLRKAILEGLEISFAKPPLPQLVDPRINTMLPSNAMPAGVPLSSLRSLPIGRGLSTRGMMHRPVPARGGQLEIAGVVVGSWGPNFGSRGSIGVMPGRTARRGDIKMVPPQVTKVGGLKAGRIGLPPNLNWNSPIRGARGARRARGVNRGARNNVTEIKNKTTNKKSAQQDELKGLGRGMTLEEPDSARALPVSELLKKGEYPSAGGDGKELKVEDGQFDDATSLPNKSDTVSVSEEGGGDAPSPQS